MLGRIAHLHVLLLVLVFFLVPLSFGQVLAAGFCVSTAAELSTALLQAEGNGQDDVIRIVQGTYVGNFVYSSSEAFDLTIRGGYLAGCGSRQVDAANTVLDGGAAASVLALVSTRVANFEVDGVTLQNGVATNNRGGGLYVSTPGELTLTNSTIADNRASDVGGGVYVASSVTTVTNGTIADNTAFSYGGGIYVASSAGTVTVADTAIRDNTVTGSSRGGGGIYVASTSATVVQLAGNRFERNTALSFGSAGGAIAILGGNTITVANNTIANNAAYYVGGARLSSTTVSLIDNVISNNTATELYGALSLGGGAITLSGNTISGNRARHQAAGVIGGNTKTLNANAITGNAASSDDGGILISGGTAVLVNNVVSDNYAGGHRAGIALFDPSGATLTNNTITNNSAAGDGGGLWLRLVNNSDTAHVYNNIVWNNEAARGADLFLDNDGNGDFIRSPVNLFSNDFDKTQPQGTYMKVPFLIDPSNLDNADPLFVDAVNGDYRLQAGSPVIDLGDNGAPELPQADKDGNPRIQGAAVDMGAFEFVTRDTLVTGDVTVGGLPEAGLRVKLKRRGVGVVASDRTDGNGYYELGPVGPGTYTIQSAKFDVIGLTTVGGSVRVGGNPAARKAVRLKGVTTGNTLRGETDATGHFVFADVPPDVYRLSIKKVVVPGG